MQKIFEVQQNDDRIGNGGENRRGIKKNGARKQKEGKKRRKEKVEEKG